MILIEDDADNLTEVNDSSITKRPERILGITYDNDEGLMFMVSWSIDNTATLVPSHQARVEYPQLVIDFYQERLIFSDTDES